MRQVSFLLISIISIIAIMSCAPTGPEDFATSVSGTVVHSATGVLLDSVAFYYVTDDSLHFLGYTDTTGIYGWADWGYKTITLSFHKEGYRDDSVSVQGSTHQLTFTGITVLLADTTTG